MRSLLCLAAVTFFLGCVPPPSSSPTAPKSPAQKATAGTSTCPPFVGGSPNSEAPQPVIAAAHKESVTRILFSPNGKRLVTESLDSAKIWDVATRVPLATLKRPAECSNIYQPRWWDDNKVFIVCGSSALFFDVETAQWQKEDALIGSEPVWIGPQAGLRWAAKAGKQIWLVDDHWRPVAELDLPKGESWRVLQPKVTGEYHSLYSAGDGSAVAAAREGHVVIWRRATAAGSSSLFQAPTEHRLPTKRSFLGELVVGPNGSIVAYTEDGAQKGSERIVVMSTSTNQPIARLDAPPSDRPIERIGELRFIANGKRLLAATKRGAVVWDIASARIVLTAGPDQQLAPLAIDPSESVLATESGDSGVVALYDAKSGRFKGELGTPAIAAESIGWRSDTELITMAHVGNLRDARYLTWENQNAETDLVDRSRIRTWSLSEAKLAKDVTLDRLVAFRSSTFTGEYSPLTKLPFQRTECPLPKRALRLNGHTLCLDAEKAIHIANDKSVVVSRKEDAQRIDVATGKAVSLPILTTGPDCLRQPGLFNAGISAKGTYVIGRLCGGTGHRIWDAQSGKVIFDLRDDATYFSSSQAIAPDEKHAIVVMRGRTAAKRSRVTVIDLPSGAVVRTFELKTTEHIDGVGFGPTPDVVLALSDDGFIEVTDKGAPVRTIDVGIRTTLESMAISPSGTRVAVTGPDGGIRIFDTATGQQLLTLVDFDDGEWTMFTPGGAYTGTHEVSDRVGWVFANPAEPFRFEQFASYRNEGVIRKRFAGDLTADIAPLRGRPPSVEIVKSEGNEVRVRVNSHRRVDVVRAFVEGAPADTKTICSSAAQAVETTLRVPLRAGTNDVSIVAYDDRGFASNNARVSLRGAATRAQVDAWIVAAGIDRYPALPESMQLGAAENDARSMAEALKPHVGGEGKMYRSLHETTLLGDKATPAAIQKALEGLAAMRPEDVAIVFFAGHGLKQDQGNSSGEMLFVTSGVKLTADGRAPAKESLASSTLSWTQIATSLSQAKGRVILLLDACHSGHLTTELVVPNEAFAAKLAEKGRAGVVIFAAAKGPQLSYEPASSRGLVLDTNTRLKVRGDTHGFFTGAWLASLADPATDRDQDGQLSLSEVIDDVTRRVRVATRGLQTPWVARREIVGELTLAPTPK